MSTITDTYVVNLALGHLGDHRISNFNQNDPSAASARDHWEFARLDALSAYEWSFASEIVKLNQSGVTPVGEYTYRYDKPNAWVRTNRVSPDTSFQTDFRRWTDRNNKIDTDESTIYMDYVYDHTTIGLWTPWFVNYMAVSLAGMMNPRITTSKSMKKDMMQIKKEALSSARSRDNQQQPNRKPKQGDWMRARRGAGNTMVRHGY